MSFKDGIPAYSRQQLRKASKFVEGDYDDINPREFYRNLKRSIEEIQDASGFKYQTYGDPNTDFEISSESVGKKTGTVEGRLVAESDWLELGRGILEYRPYGPHGALGIIVGLMLAIFGINSPAVALLGVAVAVGGGYYYFQTETEEFPISRQDIVRVFITGEVSERTVNAGGETRTEMVANMSVVYAGDSYMRVETNRLDELDWTFRREFTSQVKQWYNSLMDQERAKKDVEEGFVSHLKAWSNKSLDSDRRTIEDTQNRLRNMGFETRTAYTNILQNQLPRQTTSELNQQQENLLDELEELANDVEIYVEREGYEHTNQIERDSQDNPELESGRD
jgi:hypothetical protein